MWKRIYRISDKRLSLFIAFVLMASILFLFLPIVLVSINQVINKGEIQDTEQEVIRSENIILNEVDRLDQYLLDWSAWDDTYEFAQDRNQDFIDNNLSDASVINLGIDAFITLDLTNRVVYEKYVDPDLGVETPNPLDVQRLIREYPSLVTHPDLSLGEKGIAVMDNIPMLVASRPILPSDKEGPASGTMIWIRLLNLKQLAHYSKLANRELAVYRFDAPENQNKDWLIPTADDGQVMVFPQDEKTILGVKYLLDLNQQPLLALEVENTRSLYQQGRSTAAIISIVLISLGVVLFGATYHFTNMFLRARKTGRDYLQRYETIVDQTRDAMLLISGDFRIIMINPAGKNLLGIIPGQTQVAQLKSFLTFDPPLDEKTLSQLCQNDATSEHRCKRRDAVEFIVELSASMINLGGFPAYSLMVRDVTASKKAEMALKTSEERYMLAANGSKDGLWDWNLNSGEVYYSHRWKTMLGYDDSEIDAKPEEWLSRVHPDDHLMLQTQLSTHLSKKTDSLQCEYRIKGKDGHYHWMLARGVAVWDPSGFAKRIAGSQTDIHAQKKLEEQLRHDALHDALTGIGNRTLLLDHLSHVNERKKRKPELLFALIFLDFDRFKQINDTLGHKAGDELLIEASKRLESGLRSADTVARYTGPETLARIAGDEFVLLLEDFQWEEDIHKVVARLTTLLNNPYQILGQEVSLTASIGLVIPKNAYENPEDIIRDADIAMYRAKQLGGAQVVQFSEEMYQGTLERMQLENDLRKAVEQRQFEVYYQPIFSLEKDQISGFEALVRWNHPQKGLLLPEKFIRIADDIGMIIPMGMFVLEEACFRMQAWRKSLQISPELMISVNLSVRQLLDPNLVNNIQLILEKTEFDPKKLWLEVTEGSLLESNELVLKRLNDLRALGIRIEIDDFGTGYSSLSYLQNLPIDGFKIDRSFIKDIHEGNEKIVKTLIELGHSLGLTEVAEGVETEHQKEFLKTISCKYAQGFLMSRPISADAIENMLKSMVALN